MFIFGRLASVGQRPIKSLSCVCFSVCLCPSVYLSVHLSIQPSLSFLKTESLVFSGILHDNSWPWYLVSDAARFLKKNFGGPYLGPMGLNQAQNDVFHSFLEFGSYFFLEIAYNNRLQQCLTSSRGKTHKTIFWA